MKTLTAMVMAVALLAAACGGDDGTSGGPRGPGGEVLPTEGPVSIPPDLPTREGPGGVPVPDVEPSIPGLEGEPTSTEHRVEDRGVDPLPEGISPRPVMLLARSPQEANAVIEKAPPAAREVLTSFEGWGRRALIIFTGGAQPDASYRVEARGISVIEGGRTIQAFGRFRERRRGGSAQVSSVPWIAVSLDVRATVKGERCVLAFEGLSGVESDCH